LKKKTHLLYCLKFKLLYLIKKIVLIVWNKALLIIVSYICKEIFLPLLYTNINDDGSS